MNRSCLISKCKFLLFIVLLFCFTIDIKAISGSRDSTINFFPDNRLYPNVFLDPLECQIGGGSYFLSRRGEENSLYSTINFGFIRPVISRRGKSISWEISFGGATFSQFDLVRKQSGGYLAGLLNNDYKISADFSIKKGNQLLRFRIFHLSSHLGDDYMLRNSDFLPNDKSVNYEQADLTYLRKRGSNYWYAGAGEIYTKYVFRERLSFQGGGLLNFGKPKQVNLFTSLNLKLFAENDFDPDIRAAFGVTFNRKSESFFKLWLEYYSGQLPYSTLNFNRVTWIGPALQMSIF